MSARAEKREKALKSRFRIARGFVLGEFETLHDLQAAAQAAGVSRKTVRRDIARAGKHQKYEDWRPQRPGPKTGDHRTSPAQMVVIEGETYARADQKRNIAKAARDLDKDIEIKGAGKPQSLSTLKRRVRSVETGDRAHFEIARHGRDGRHQLSLQKGSVTAERPMQIVQMDHTKLDQLSFFYLTEAPLGGRRSRRQSTSSPGSV